MKRVVVSMRIDELADRDERRDAVDQKLIRFIISAGFMPVLVSNSLVEIGGTDENGDLVRFLDEVDPVGVVLSGGNDVGSCEDRDLTERILLDYALNRGLPALGICRGMQMMGVYFGESLVEVSGHVRTRHLLGGEVNRNVNSYHNLGLSGCPDGFDVL